MCNTFATHTQENRIIKNIYYILYINLYIYYVNTYYILHYSTLSTLFYQLEVSGHVSIPNPKQPEGTPP